MGQFVLEYAGQFRCDRTDSVYRDSQLAIVDCATPGRSVCHVEKCLIGVKNDRDAVAGRNSEFADKIVVFQFQGVYDGAPQGIRGLFPLVPQSEMAGLVLSE